MSIILIPVLFSLLTSIFATPLVIRFFRARGFGQEIRDDGPLTHMVKRGTPTMGGVAIIGSTIVGYLVAWPFIGLVRLGARQLALDVALTPSAALTVFGGALTLCLSASFVTFRKIASIDPAIVFRT